MAIIQDGSHKFGILAPTATGVDITKGFTIESFSQTLASNRVDLNDGNGEPSGAVVVPQREEFSLTCQAGNSTNNFIPSVGDLFFLASNPKIVTDVTVNETQEDFVRFDTTCYTPTNTPLPFYFARTSTGEDYNLTGYVDGYATFNKSSLFGAAVNFESFNYIQGFGIKQSSGTLVYRFEYDSDSLTLSTASSTLGTGVTFGTSGTGFFSLNVTSVPSIVTATLHFNEA